MRLIAAAVAVACFAFPAVAGVDPGILAGGVTDVGAPDEKACEWSRAHFLFNNNTKHLQGVYVYLVDPDNPSSLSKVAAISVAPGGEEKFYVSPDRSYVVHTSRNGASIVGVNYRFDFPSCDNPKLQRAYMLTWTKDYEIKTLPRRK